MNVSVRAAWIVLAFALTAVSCEGSTPEPPKPSAAASTPDESAGSGLCSPARDPSLPEQTGCVSMVMHGEETLTVYASLDEAGEPRRWFAIVRRPGVDAKRDLGHLLDNPRAVGASEVDGDGRPEWWIHIGDYVGHGAPWAYLHLFFSEGRKLVPLEWNGDPLAINYGGISRLGEGAECRGGKLVLLRAEAQDRRNSRWRLSRRTFSIAGHRARLVDRTEHLITIDDYLDPRVRRYFRVVCHGDVFVPF